MVDRTACPAFSSAYGEDFDSTHYRSNVVRMCRPQAGTDPSILFYRNTLLAVPFTTGIL